LKLSQTIRLYLESHLEEQFALKSKVVKESLKVEVRIYPFHTKVAS
jgi:hypothetical protein